MESLYNVSELEREIKMRAYFKLTDEEIKLIKH
jgi:hypothetical protein